MFNVSADLSPIGNTIAAVHGTLNAVEGQRFKGRFVNSTMNSLRKKFMADAIAANISGAASLQHVFEWPDQDARGISTGRPSSVPLFILTKQGRGGNKSLSFSFLPSEKQVPLPNPARYGFKEEKLAFMHRHVFRMKALVMETQSNVQIAPRNANKLFIPTADNKYGYVMTKKSTLINPGGLQSTGGFSKFWTAWFETRAQEILNEKSAKAASVIAKTGQKVVRYMAGTKIGGVSVGGRFASGKGVSIAYIKAETRRAEMLAEAELFAYYPDEDWGN